MYVRSYCLVRVLNRADGYSYMNDSALMITVEEICGSQTMFKAHYTQHTQTHQRNTRLSQTRWWCLSMVHT